MDDIALLGIQVQTDSVARGGNELEKLLLKAEKTEKGVNVAAKGMGDSLKLAADKTKVAATSAGVAMDKMGADIAASATQASAAIAVLAEKSFSPTFRRDATAAAALKDALGGLNRSTRDQVEEMLAANREQAEYANHLSETRARFDPLFAAQMRYETELREIADAERMGALTAQQAAGARDRASRSMLGMASATNTAAIATRRFDLRGMSMQLSQVAQSAMATGRPLQALAIQLPDIGLAFGTIGIAAGVAAGVLLPLAANFIGMGDNAKEVEDRLDALSTALQDYQNYAELAGRTTADLRAEFGEFAEDMRRHAQFMAQVSISQARGALAGESPFTTSVASAEGLARTLEQRRAALAAMRANPNTNDPMAVADATDALAVIQSAAEDAAKKLGLLPDEVLRLGNALKAISVAKDPLSIRDAASEAIDLIQSLYADATDIPTAMADAITKLNAVMTAAASGVVTMEDTITTATGNVSRTVKDTETSARTVAGLIAARLTEEAKLKAGDAAATARIADIDAALKGLGTTGMAAEQKLDQLDASLASLIATAEKTDAGGAAMSAAEAQAKLLRKAIEDVRGSVNDLDETGLNSLIGAVQSLVGAFKDLSEGMSGLSPIAQSYVEYGRSRVLGQNMSYSSAADQGLLALIRAAEGTSGPQGYNTSLGYGAYLPGGQEQNLVNMTLIEIRDLQRQMLANPDNPYNSSALGAYQIVGQTLDDLMQQLRLSGNELFSEEMQDRLATQLLRTRGLSTDALRGTWQGLERVNESTIARAASGQTISPDDPLTKAADAAVTSENVQRANVLYQQLLETVNAAAAAQREFTNTQRELDEALKEGRISPEQWAQAMANAKEKLDATTESIKLQAEAIKDLNEDAKGFLSDVFSGLLQGASAGEILANVLDKIASKLADMAAQGFADALFPTSSGGGSGGGILGFLGSLLGIGSTSTSATTAASSVITYESYDGGGYTGDGPRSGGVDGIGGFPAILHPGEIVTDTTKGQAGGEVLVRVTLDPNLRAEIVGESAGVTVEIVAENNRKLGQAQRRNG